MKNIIFTTCLILILFSCGEREESKTLAQKDINKQTDPTFKTEELDEVFEQPEVKAGGFMADYAATHELRFLDSAFIYFNKSRVQTLHEPYPSINCGIISEKLGRIKDANEFYNEAKKIAKQNLANPKAVLKDEYGNSTIKEIAKDLNLNEDEIMKSLHDTQMFYLLLAKILLKENSQDDISKFKEIATTSRNISIAQYKNVKKREDILNRINGN